MNNFKGIFNDEHGTNAVKPVKLIWLDTVSREEAIRDALMRKPVVYPYLAHDPILFAEKLLGYKQSETEGGFNNE